MSIDIEPRTPDERQASAEAVVRARADAESLDHLVDLEPHAAELAQIAYDRGRREMMEEVAALCGPAATQVDAVRLRATLAGTPARLDFSTEPRMPGGSLWRSPARVQAARLVTQARRIAERGTRGD